MMAAKPTRTKRGQQQQQRRRGHFRVGQSHLFQPNEPLYFSTLAMTQVTTAVSSVEKIHRSTADINYFDPIVHPVLQSVGQSVGQWLQLSRKQHAGRSRHWQSNSSSSSPIDGRLATPIFIPSWCCCRLFFIQSKQFLAWKSSHFLPTGNVEYNCHDQERTEKMKSSFNAKNTLSPF